jgi:ketosteroid isomerase-like protein
MDHARRSIRPQLLAITLVAAMGCFAPQPSAITVAKAKSVTDTVTVLENAMNLAVDRLDCTAGFASIGDLEPMMVSSARVRRSRATFRATCDTMVAPRTGAVFVIDTLSVHALGPDAAYVVREGVYTVNLKDGTTRRSYFVMTTIWSRQGGSWKMEHLHESSRALAP